MQSIERALKLISIIENSSSAKCTLADLTKASGLPPSTIHRILSIFVKHRYVYQDEISKQYSLGSRLVELGLQARDSMDIRRRALPIMEAITAETGETSYLTVQSGYYGVYIEKVESNQNLRLFEPMGAAIPLHSGASRKVLLAYLPDSFVDEMHRKGLLTQLTSKTIIDPVILKEGLQAIRRDGYAVSFGENIENAASVAAPVLDANNEVIGCLSIAGPTYRITDQRVKEFIHIIKLAAQELSICMGWTGNISEVLINRITSNRR